MKWRYIILGILLAIRSVCEVYGNTDLVTVAITAIDRNGQPVEDLKASDFKVTEDGKPQQIAVFLLRMPDIDGSLAQAVATQPGATEQVRTQRLPLWSPQPANLVHRRLLAMLFDFGTMPVPAQVRVRQSAIDFIRKDLTPADLVTVMATSNGKLDVLQDFTDDLTALEAAVTRVNGGGQPEPGILSAKRKLIAIEDACRQLSAPRLIGRKALLYLSGGFPLPGMYIQAAWENAAHTCIRANAAIYPITEENESLSRLVAVTGGTILPPLTDMTASMKLARDKIGGHYVLGYFSTNMRSDGAWRKVEAVTVRAGTRLDYQHGYFADTYFWSFRR